MTWQLNKIDVTLIQLALQEDLGIPYCDLATQTLFPTIDKKLTKAHIISKHPESITVCGLPIVEHILNSFALNNDAYRLQIHRQDAEILFPGEILLTIEAPAQILLMAERTILNFLQRLSGVATLTNKFVQAVKTSQLKILDTRKTTPGFRHLEKYAVHCGGGVNHRMGLYDAIMVKDTHIDALGGMSKALAQLPADILKTCPVIIEVRSKEELNVVLQEGKSKVTRVLLDNMSTELMDECVKQCKHVFPTEASGNISLDNIVAIAQTGVNFASIGKLTHSAGSVDLSMKTEF